MQVPTGGLLSKSKQMIDMRELSRRHLSGEKIDYLFFSGHQPDETGLITKSCLSQFYPSPFRLAGVLYPTAEHWMMASKARLFGDHVTEREILSASHARRAKKLGRRVSGFVSDVWNAHALKIVIDGNVAKFQQNAELREYLMSTGNKILAEASPHDRLWGIGLHESDLAVYDPASWPGRNLLGFALMEVRSRLKTSRKERDFLRACLQNVVYAFSSLLSMSAIIVTWIIASLDFGFLS